MSGTVCSDIQQASTIYIGVWQRKKGASTAATIKQVYQQQRHNGTEQKDHGWPHHPHCHHPRDTAASMISSAHLVWVFILHY